jgi:membrane protein implicated in regulation of membrane protease activity
MSIYLIWFLIGVAFLVSEMISPVFILFFFGMGAWITSLVTAFLPELNFNQQIIIFSVSSLLLLLLLRQYLQNIFYGNQNLGEECANIEVDVSAIVTKDIPKGGFGEIKYRGTFYKAKNKDSNIEVSKGTSVLVVKKGDDQGSFYIIKEID